MGTNSLLGIFSKSALLKTTQICGKIILGDVPIMNSIMLGNKIRDLREEKNLSQDELSERISLSVNAISNIEGGKSSPNLRTIVSIATELESSIDFLVSEEISKSKNTYINEILIKLSKMDELEIRHIYKYISLWNESKAERENDKR